MQELEDVARSDGPRVLRLRVTRRMPECRPAPSTPVFLRRAGLVLALVILAPEGGWWFVPAVVAQLLLDRRAALAMP
jgi:hypothetical protein